MAALKRKYQHNISDSVDSPSFASQHRGISTPKSHSTTETQQTPSFQPATPLSSQSTPAAGVVGRVDLPDNELQQHVSVHHLLIFHKYLALLPLILF